MQIRKDGGVLHRALGGPLPPRKVYADAHEDFGSALVAPWLVLRNLAREPDARVEDLGWAELDGRRVRKLFASMRGEWTINFTVYADPSLNGLVVRIEQKKLVDCKEPRRAVFELAGVSLDVADSLLRIPASSREQEALEEVVTGGVLLGNAGPICTSVTADSTKIAVGDSISVTANATDVDGDALVYSWTATGDTIVGFGPPVMWDTTGLTPGT